MHPITARAGGLLGAACALAAAGWLPGVSGTGGGGVWDVSGTPLAAPLTGLALLGGATALGAAGLTGERGGPRGLVELGLLAAAWAAPRMSFAHLVVAVALSVLVAAARPPGDPPLARSRPRPALVLLQGGLDGPYSRPSAREISRAVKSTSGITRA